MARSSALAVAGCTVQPATPAGARLKALPVDPPRSGAFRPLRVARHDPSLSLAEQQRRWCVAAQQGDEAATAALLDSIRLFVMKAVYRYARAARRQGIQASDIEDMEGAAWVSILRSAIPKFEAERGYTVITYFKPWIEQACGRWLADHARQARVPVHMHERRRQIAYAREVLRAELHREPTSEEVGDRLGLSAGQVQVTDTAFLRPLALDMGQRFEDGSGDSLVDRLPHEGPTPEDVVMGESRQVAVRRLMRGLRARELDILRSRFGDEDQTLGEIGDRLGLSRERVRQVQDGALGKLRAKVARKGFER